MKNLFLLVPILVFFTISCKTVPLDSDLSSLSPEELKSCSFNGKRYVISINPALEFQGSIDLMRDTFVEDFADQDSLVSKKYLDESISNNAGKLAACRKYYMKQASLYTEKPVLYGSAATLDNVRSFFRKQADSIRRQRQIWAGKYGKKRQPEIQIILSFVGHGSNNPSGSGGYLALHHSEKYDYQTAVEDLYAAFFTKCSSGQSIDTESCDKISDANRLADELIIFATNCYSGNLSNRLETYVNSKSYPKLTKQSTGYATRYFAAASSTSQQVSWFYGGESQLHKALKETIQDKNGARYDGDPNGISLFDTREYIKATAFSRHFNHSRSALEKNVAYPLICGDANNRKMVFDNLDRNKSFFETNFFRDPVKTITSTDLVSADGQSGQGSAYSISTPSFHSNMNDDLLKAYWFSTAGPDSQTADGKNTEDLFTKNIEGQKQEIRHLGEIIQAVYKKLDAVLKTPTTTAAPQPTYPSTEGTTRSPEFVPVPVPNQNGLVETTYNGSTDNSQNARATIPGLEPTNMNFTDPETIKTYNKIWQDCNAGQSSNSQTAPQPQNNYPNP